MSLAENMAAARAANKYVKSKYTIGAYNRPIDVHLANVNYGINLRAAIDQQRTTYTPTPMRSQTGVISEAAEASGMGNCGEMAISAYEYLRWEHVEVQTALLQTTGHWNHSFVVIGAPSLRENDRITLYTTPPGWHPDAVICDPWLSHAGFAGAVATEWSSFVSNFREVAQTELGTFGKMQVFLQSITTGEWQNFIVLEAT